MNETEIRKTADGSHTLFSQRFGEQYHSAFGAVQESEHIFINAGLVPLLLKYNPVRILEVGFGTGLNFLLTVKKAEAHSRSVYYDAIEAFPPGPDVLKELNYPGLLGFDRSGFLRLYQLSEGKFHGSAFRIMKQKLEDVLLSPDTYHLVYFDAFSPEVQPEMWNEEQFVKIFNAMKRGGVLTTYSCKGTVKRAMKSAGFRIEKLPGPPGKREFLRAFKD